jgi:hypothetical protein
LHWSRLCSQDSLPEIAGKVNKKLIVFVFWLKTKNSCKKVTARCPLMWLWRPWCFWIAMKAQKWRCWWITLQQVVESWNKLGCVRYYVQKMTTCCICVQSFDCKSKLRHYLQLKMWIGFFALVWRYLLGLGPIFYWNEAKLRESSNTHWEWHLARIFLQILLDTLATEWNSTVVYKIYAKSSLVVGWSHVSWQISCDLACW